MTPFALSMLTSLVGGLISVGAAAAFTVALSPAMLSRLVSYAVGALLGAATGALGAGGASGIGAKLGTDIGGKILGQTASTAAKSALGQAAIQGTLGTIAGQDPLSSTLGGAFQGYLMTPKTPGAPTTAAPATAAPATAAPPTAAAPATAAPAAISVPNSLEEFYAANAAPAATTFDPVASAQSVLDAMDAGDFAGVQSIARACADVLAAGRDFVGDRIAHALDALDGRGDFLGRVAGAFGELAHFVGHHREAASLFAGPCGLDGGVEGEEVGLVGDVVDDLDDLADLLAGFAER